MPLALLCDRVFIAAIVFLILATPFAFGTVQAWAYSAMEAVIFGLVIVWMIKRAILAREHGAWSTEQGAQHPIPNTQHRLAPVALPLALFVALCAMQLVPLPPPLLKIISPQTFEVYKQSLPGWPESAPYAELAQTTGTAEQGARSEKPATADGRQATEVGLQSSVTGQPSAGNATNAINPRPEAQNLTPNTQKPARGLFPETWLPLSISTGLTKIDLLKFAAFAALFFLVWRYPFEKPFEDFEFQSSNLGFFVLSPEQRFLRSVVFAVLGTGLLVAAFGFVERFAWNGNILLFVAGYESGVPAANTVARASGPFINPDHFANYLSLIFPLALGGALFRTFMVPKSGEYGLKIFCGFTTFLLFTGILLSLSRGGWISALLGISIFAWLSPWRREAQGGRSETQHLTPSTQDQLGRFARLSLVTLCILLIVSLFVAGQAGREQVDLRLGETIAQQGGLGARVTVILKDIPKMIMDFPLFGVGLGAWPELFLRYRSGPWSTVFFREAHNDYLEVLAETGFIGFGLLAVFFFVAGQRLVRGLTKSSSKHLPLIAAILAGLGGMALHEWLDFSLQIPSNAFLFTVLLAIGMRMARSKEQRAGSREHGLESIPPWESGGESFTTQWSEVDDRSAASGRPSSVAGRGSLLHALSSMQASATLLHALSSMRAGAPYAGIAAAAIMIAFAVTQDQSSYPQNLREMTSLAEAKELLLEHPTHSPYHLSVVRLAGPNAPLEWQLTQAKAALWNEPVNPYYRDFYAATLMTMGRTEEGLKEVTRSVAESPSLGNHVYLGQEKLPLLNEDEQAAVEEGFKQALAKSYPESLTGLTEFYAKLDRFADQAALYEEAAAKETDTAKKTELLINGGLAYLRAEQSAKRFETADGRQTTEVGPRSSVSGQPSATNAERNNAINATNAKNAERLFRSAIAANLTDARAYQQMLTTIFAARQDLDGAKDVVSNGVKNGAPALPLYLSLAEAAQKAGSTEETKAALKLAKAEVDKLIKNGEDPHALYMSLADGAHTAGDRETETAAVAAALERQPRSPETLMRLAGLYLAKQNYSRATLYLNRVANIKPDSADVYYSIAQAEEGQYRFAAAAQAYARAVQLAPQNASYRQRYDAFRERVAANAPERDPKVANRKRP